jgi:hypothetical protein
MFSMNVWAGSIAAASASSSDNEPPCIRDNQVEPSTWFEGCDVAAVSAEASADEPPCMCENQVEPSTWFEGCDVAVVSAEASADGRPFIWKNRDEPNNWMQGVRYYQAKDPEIGGYTSVVERKPLTRLVIPSGGVNECGFGISLTTVYSGNLIREILNANHILMRHALEECKTVEDFENLLNSWGSRKRSRIINANIAIIDAYGGAAMYEAYTEVVGGPVIYEKFDANEATDEDGNFIGFVNRTNSNQWYQTSGEERRWRAYEMMCEMVAEGRLSYRNVMQEVAKDVCGDVPKDDDLESFDTWHCISRAITNLALVIHGVAPGQDPRLNTFWIILGEPSVGVATPFFPYAHNIPYLARAGRITGSCPLNLAIVYRELHLYSNNGFDLIPISFLDFIPIDYTINYSELLKVQEYSIPIEDTIFEKTEEYLAEMEAEPERITSPNLYQFSKYCAKYAYRNYTYESADYYPWEFDPGEA